MSKLAEVAVCAALMLSALLTPSTARAEGPVPAIIQGPPPGWEIVKITDDPEQDRRVAMNNVGQIVFSKRAIPNPGGTREEIYLYDNGKLRRLTNDILEDASPDINDAGVIVWNKKDPGTSEHEIMRYTDGVIEQLTNDAVDQLGPSIGNDGTIIWPIWFSSVQVELYRYENGNAVPITDNGFTNVCVTINASGDYAWVRYEFNLNPWVSTIMCSIGGEVHETSDGTTQAQGCGINDAGTTVWHDNVGVLMRTNGVISVLPNSLNGRGPRISNAGDVIYGLSLGNFGSGMLFRDGQTYQLIDTPELAFHGYDISDSGEVAFGVGDFPELDIALLWRTRDPGDFTGDKIVDRFDFESMQNCMSNVECGVQMPPVCLDVFDFDSDGDIDFRDFALFQRLVTPANN